MKSYTDIEQSKKLVEILQIESADMYYHYTTGVKSYYEDVPRYVQVVNHFVFFHNDIPCWSLAALLSVIPEVSLNTFKDKKWNVMIQHNGKIIYKDKNNAIDACYELILELNECKML